MDLYQSLKTMKDSPMRSTSALGALCTLGWNGRSKRSKQEGREGRKEGVIARERIKHNCLIGWEVGVVPGEVLEKKYSKIVLSYLLYV